MQRKNPRAVYAHSLCFLTSLIWFPYSPLHQNWRKAWQPTPIFLSGKSHGQGSLMDYSPWDCKELNVTEHKHTSSFSAVTLIYGKNSSRFTLLAICSSLLPLSCYHLSGLDLPKKYKIKPQNMQVREKYLQNSEETVTTT